MHPEIELKLKIQPQDINRLEACELLQKYNNGTPERHFLISTYFDTTNLDFIHKRIALRIRRKGKQIIQTIKYDTASSSGLTKRPEIEWLLPSPQPDLTLARDNLPEALQHLDASELIPVFETRFHRTSYVLNWPGSSPATIEVAIDHGEVTTGQQSVNLCELELELLSGEENSLHELHNCLQSEFQLEPCDTSKAALGYQLAAMANTSAVPI